MPWLEVPEWRAWEPCADVVELGRHGRSAPEAEPRRDGIIVTPEGGRRRRHDVAERNVEWSPTVPEADE